MAEAVVVKPKPESESKTIADNKKIAWWSGFAVVVPTLVEILFRILSEPAVAAWIVNYFPYQMRLVVVAIIGIALKAIADRKKVVAPIEGTPAAQALTSVQDVSALPQSGLAARSTEQKG